LEGLTKHLAENGVSAGKKYARQNPSLATNWRGVACRGYALELGAVHLVVCYAEGMSLAIG
jgi:hypothetical protein